MSEPALLERGLGYRPDDAAGLPRDRRARARLLAIPPAGAAPIPARASLRKYVLSILNQGSLGSCTANAVAQAVRARLAFNGVTDPKLVSRLFLYYMARAYERLQHEDSGAQLRNVFAGLVRYGYPAEEVWPYSDDASEGAPFMTMPRAEAFRESFDARLMSYERIDSEGRERIDDCKRAIASGHLVVFGTAVSHTFCTGYFDARRPLPPPIGLEIEGNHALTLAEYDGDDFGVPNSWGEGWGDGGWFRMSADYVTWEGTQDLWIVERVVPPVAAAPAP